MTRFRNLTPAEIAEVERLGSTAEEWSLVTVSDDFRPSQLLRSHLGGRVEIASGARLIEAHVRNYRIGEGSLVEQVTALECRRESTFGNGTGVAAVNECGGRTIPLCDSLSAQAAYVAVFYRHRPRCVAALERMIRAEAEARRSTMGTVGRDCRIAGCRFLREMRIGDRVRIEGASLLEEGTLCDGVTVGVDVKASHFIAAEDARIDGGAVLERCFVGECCTLANGFTAVDSLFFAGSHCENGEAVSLFAGPCTVSHHKSTLLIAGYFSFFNAGSGSNQSNHLFKSGPVHQAIHLRGCKFGSDAYVMAPAAEAPFTVVLGRHGSHHDTRDFPFSYLVERDGRSTLMPGANLTSYGSVRDAEKWPARDRRHVRRDVVDYAEHNPYLCAGFVRALNALHALSDADPGAESYVSGRVHIGAALLRRGIGLYNKAVVASMGQMLARGSSVPGCDGSGDWLDLAGQYVTRRTVEELLTGVETGEVATLAEFDARLRAFEALYDDYAHSYAESLLAALLGHVPTQGEVDDAIAAGEEALRAMRRTAEADRDRDRAPAMSVGYGIDSRDEAEIRADFAAVRGLA